jgi:hypothetical protein
MAYMSYCAFENTLNDLRLCTALMSEACDDDKTLEEFIESRPSFYEGKAVRALIDQARQLIELSEEMERF